MDNDSALSGAKAAQDTNINSLLDMPEPDLDEILLADRNELDDYHRLRDEVSNRRKENKALMSIAKEPTRTIQQYKDITMEETPINDAADPTASPSPLTRATGSVAPPPDMTSPSIDVPALTASFTTRQSSSQVQITQQQATEGNDNDGDDCSGSSLSDPPSDIDDNTVYNGLCFSEVMAIDTDGTKLAIKPLSHVLSPAQITIARTRFFELWKHNELSAAKKDDWLNGHMPEQCLLRTSKVKKNESTWYKIGDTPDLNHACKTCGGHGTGTSDNRYKPCFAVRKSDDKLIIGVLSSIKGDFEYIGQVAGVQE